MDTQRDFSKYALDPDELRESREELARLTATRDQIVQALKSAPLKPSQRERLKNTLPLYEQKIRALRDRIIASELLGNLNPDDVNIPTHYQDRKRCGVTPQRLILLLTFLPSNPLTFCFE